MVTKIGIAKFLLLVNIWMSYGSKDKYAPKKRSLTQNESMEERALRVGISSEEMENMGGLELLFCVEEKEAEEKEPENDLMSCQGNVYDPQRSESKVCTATQFGQGNYDNYQQDHQNYDNSQYVPQNYENSQYVPQNYDNSQYVPQKYDNSQYVPQKYDNSQYVPQNYDNSQYVPQNYDNSKYVPQNYDNSQHHYQPCNSPQNYGLQFQQNYGDQTYYVPTMDMNSNGYFDESQKCDQNSKYFDDHHVNLGRKSGEKALNPSTKATWKDLKCSSRLIIISYLDKDAVANMLELTLKNTYFRKMFSGRIPNDLDEEVSKRALQLSKFFAYTSKEQKNIHSVVCSMLLRKEIAATDFVPEFGKFFDWREEQMKHLLGKYIRFKTFCKDELTLNLDFKTNIKRQHSFVHLRKEYKEGSLGYYVLQSFREILLSFVFDGNYFGLSGSDFTEDGTEVRLQYRSTSSTHSFVFLYPERKETIILRKKKPFYFFEKADTVMMLSKIPLFGETRELMTPAEFEKKATSFEYLTSQNFEKIYDALKN